MGFNKFGSFNLKRTADVVYGEMKIRIKTIQPPLLHISDELTFSCQGIFFKHVDMQPIVVIISQPCFNLFYYQKNHCLNGTTAMRIISNSQIFVYNA